MRFTPLVTATVSGRITTHHEVLPKGSDFRVAKGFFFLRLDTPLLADTGLGCSEWGKIVIMSDDPQLARWINRHVTIEGKLDRFVSALVVPSIFIRLALIVQIAADDLSVSPACSHAGGAIVMLLRHSRVRVVK